MPLPKPDAIFTHESDLDGLVAGVLLRRLAAKLFGAEPPLHAYHYSGWKQRDMREKAAWVADLAFEARFDKPDWLVVDHHPAEAEPRQARLVHSSEKSASLLAYDLCREHGLASPALDRLVHLSNVADLFLEKDPDFDAANDVANLVKVYGFWNLHDLIHGQIEQLLDHRLLEVIQAKRRIEDPLGLEWSRKHIHEVTPAVAVVETVIGNVNLIVHQLLDNPANTYQVLVTLNRGANGSLLASLRSRNGEALKVALKLQGGGHPNACGATFPKSIRSLHDAINYLRQILNPQRDTPLNSLESLFAKMDLVKK
jgi:oligoribonuclease NrnB/cAMP/cGMP phosphodiesterase (DHH superfamily)